MLEGLQSNDSSVRSLAESWVRGAIAQGRGREVHRLLQPLVKILLESDTKRRHRVEKSPSKKITLTRSEAEKDMRYAKYYFESLGVRNPYLPSSRDQYLEMVQHYTQVFDASQILYALSLLQLAVGVDPSSLISAVGNTVIDVSTYAPHLHHQQAPGEVGEGESPTAPPTTPTFPSLSSQKSLLEVILSVCVDLLCSEYHPSLRSSAAEQVENLRVKISSASLLSKLLSQLLKILTRHSVHSDEATPIEFKVHSPNFVSALLTLCDIQKVCLLLLGKAVEWWSEMSGTTAAVGSGRNGVWSDRDQLSQLSGGSDPGVILKSFYMHLLRVVQCLIALDTQFSQSLPIETHTPLQSSDLVTVVSGVNISGSLPAVSTSCATASQPFFREFLLRILSDSAFSCFHDNLLCMFTGTIANLLSQQLTDLAPKVIKQLCANIEGGVAHVGSKERGAESSDGDVQLCIVYFDSILRIMIWCLFAENYNCQLINEQSGSAGGVASSSSSQFRLHHRSPNPFFDMIRVKQVENAKESFSPMSKGPSTMAWLLGVLTAQKITSSTGRDADEASGEAGLFCRVGIGSQAGQHVTVLLPAAYNSMADMWISFHSQYGSGHGASEVGQGGRGSGGGVRWVDYVEDSVVRKQSMVHEVSALSYCIYRHIYAVS